MSMKLREAARLDTEIHATPFTAENRESWPYPRTFISFVAGNLTKWFPGAFLGQHLRGTAATHSLGNVRPQGQNPRFSSLVGQ